MSEAGISKPKPQSQTVSKCAELMNDSQRNMFDKMDIQHNAQMGAIGEIKTEVTFMKGKMEGMPVINSQIRNGKKDWRDIIIRFIIAWAPALVFLAIIGLVVVLKSKGLL